MVYFIGKKNVLCCQQLIEFLYLIIMKINIINTPHILNTTGKYVHVFDSKLFCYLLDLYYYMFL